MQKKKLIEVALPLEKINAESAREKSIRHGHPSTLHLWWARRPLAAARAVIWASLVDDPSSHPELFPTEKEQSIERQRLFKILEDLVVWENSNNQDVLNAAKAEILKSTDGNVPALLDPFAGGGAIPLEAQRLGLKAYAHDLNPVSVMINKAMIEIPPRFSCNAPINPVGNQRIKGTCTRAQGLSEDIQFYAKKIKARTNEKIGYLYPDVVVKSGKLSEKKTVISWIWVRTVSCPNPACGCQAPLMHSSYLSKKKGNTAWIDIVFDKSKPIFFVRNDSEPGMDGTVNRKGAICAKCGLPISFQYIREQGRAKKIKAILAAIIAEDSSRRVYLSPNEEHSRIAEIEKPEGYPDAALPLNPRDFKTPNYGFASFAELFTNRQLVMLTEFCNAITEIQSEIEKDAIIAGMKNDHIPLCEGGNGAQAYSEAIIVYLSFLIDKLADYHSANCSWNAAGQKMRNTFGRQAIPMVWDFAECNPFCSSSGSFDNMLNWIVKSVAELPYSHFEGNVEQFDAQSDCGLRNIMVSTDPPYYDNIGYADLSDYFYIWQKKNLRNIYKDLFKTMLVPKGEELVATPYRHDGSANDAKIFFENGMLASCEQIYKYVRNDIPVSIYYAYKQSDIVEEEGKIRTASSGWETMLTSIIEAGFAITGTWPMRTEMAVRMIATGTNALASSIVLVCRKRRKDAPQVTRRNLINALRRELRPALKNLQESNIAPVDLSQSAIGPGMGVFSRYSRVLEADGSPMTVRSALRIINEEVDLYFNEQVSDLDSMSRFCVDLYTQSAFNDIKFGDADVLARAKGTSVAALASHNVVYAKAGTVHLIDRADLPEKIDVNESCIWMLTQQLTQAMATGGVEACAKAVFTMIGSNAERAKDLAYRLYTIAEQKKWSTEAFAYNALVVAWPDIQSRAAMMQREKPEQMDMFSMGLLDT